TPSKTCGAIIYGKNVDNQVALMLKIWGVVKQLFIKLILSHQKKQTGHPPLLNTSSQQELKAFVQENGENHRLCAKKLLTVWTSHLKNPISAFTIRRILKKLDLML
ncbi:16811_t:CDS:1, partial [Funneliformis geosporum]